MPPSPLFSPPMDSGPAGPPPPGRSMAAGPSSLWRLADRRSRKAGSGNIFSSVNLWQLQRLFRAAGDQDAEQRAQLVCCQGDEAELAQALIGLRARGHRRGLRTHGREVLGSHWLRAFNHLRIGESSTSSQVKDPVDVEEDQGDSEAAAHSSPDPDRDTFDGATGCSGTGATVEPAAETQSHPVTPDRPVRTSSGLRRGAVSNPERYLHRILH